MDSPAEDNRGVGFNGLRVVGFESRMAAEPAAIIQRFGGSPIIAPAMREVPLEDNGAAFDFALRLLDGRVDIAIFLAGGGVREVFRVIETRDQRATLVAALASTTSVARGPKPVVALRELGIEPAITIAEPNTWREILLAL